MQAQMKDVEKRVKGYWFNDGVAELIGGAVFVMLGIYFAATEMLGSSSLWGGILQVGFILILLGLLWGGRRLIAKIKNEFVYPRTGFVKYRVDQQQVNQRRIGAAVVAAVVAVIIVVLLPLEGPINWVAGLTGLLVGGVLIFGQARNAGIERFLYLGFLSLLLGVLASMVSWANGFALGLYYAGMGSAFMVSGAWIFWHFLRQYPISQELINEK